MEIISTYLAAAVSTYFAVTVSTYFVVAVSTLFVVTIFVALNECVWVGSRNGAGADRGGERLQIPN